MILGLGDISASQYRSLPVPALQSVRSKNNNVTSYHVQNDVREVSKALLLKTDGKLGESGLWRQERVQQVFHVGGLKVHSCYLPGKARSLETKSSVILTG